MSESSKKPRSKPRSKKVKETPKEAALPQWFKNLLIAVFLVLILTIAGTVIFFINYFKNISSDVTIEIQGPEEVLRGVPFEVDVSISNNTDGLVTQAELTLSSTNGIVNLSGLNVKEIKADAVGDLGSGSLAKRTYRFLAVGDVDSIEEIVFNLSYFAFGGNRFETKEIKKVKIKSSAIEFEVKKPDQILPGSAFELTIQYKNVSQEDLPETFLEIKYPSSFKFISSSLSPDSLNNYWRLGELRSGSGGDLKLKGTLEGANDTSFIFPIIFGARFLGEDFPVTTKEIELTISPAPVGINVLINRQTNYVARIGDRLTYTIQYTNSSGIALKDVVIKAELNGELYDFTTLVANADFNLATRTVTWDVSRVPGLRLLDAGASGEASLEIKLKNQFPISRLNDKNFTLKFAASITSPSVPYYLSASATKSETRVETKVAGLVEIDAKAFYRDALSKIVNLGPMPPKVGQATQYTIHWSIRNYGTDVSNVRLSAFLSPNVLWTGQVKSNTDSVPLYNEETREIIWTIDKIKATKGILDEPFVAAFQIEATPTPTDLGKFQDLITPTVLRATDDFTGLELLSSDVALNTSLPDDITIGQSGGRVVP